MSETTKTVLIVGGLAVIGYVAYNFFKARAQTTQRNVPQPSNSTGANSSTGNWWDNLGQWGGAISGGINSIDGLFGGSHGAGPATTGGGSGPSGDYGGEL